MAQGGVRGPRLREQSGLLPSAAVVGGWGPPSMVPGRHPAPGSVGLGSVQGTGVRWLTAARDGPHSTGRSTPSTGQARSEPSLCLLPCVGDPDPVLRCIVSGFFANAARFHSTGVYR